MTTVVLVSEDVVYTRERVNHWNRLLMFQRPQIVGPSVDQTPYYKAAKPLHSVFDHTPDVKPFSANRILFYGRPKVANPGNLLLAAPGWFVYIGAPSANNYQLDVSPGTFTETGQAVGLFGGGGALLNPGQFGLTGIAATLSIGVPGGITLSLGQGQFALQGLQASFSQGALPDSEAGTTGMPGGFQTLRPKTSAEQIDYPFDFGGSLGAGETISGVPQISAQLYTGTDPLPNIVGGPAVVSGAQVFQMLLAGKTGCIYVVTCTIQTSLGQTLSRAGLLTIISGIPT